MFSSFATLKSTRHGLSVMLSITDKPCLVDFRVAKEENVWPMVPAGKSLHEMDGLDILQSLI